MLDAAHVIFEEGLSLYKSGDLPNARCKFIESLSHMPEAWTTEQREVRAKSVNMLGICEMCRSHFGTAFDLFYEATCLSPINNEYWIYFSQAAMRLGLREKAISFCEQGIACKPDVKLGYEAMGMICKEQKKYPEALKAFLQAYTLQAPCARNAHFVADIYHWAGYDKEAEEWYDHTFSLDPDYADAHFSITFFLMKHWRLDEAKMHAEKGCKSEINGNLSRYNLSLINLTLGNFKDGWRDHECRLLFKECDSDSSIVANRFKQKIWSGQTHIDDHGSMRTAIIHAHTEQGFGDSFHFCRYLPMIRDRGCGVHFECQSGMVELMQYNFPFAKVMCRAPDYPGNSGLPDFDYHVPLMSLPHIFGTTLENIPSRPYLAAPPDYIRKWDEKLKHLNGMRVGLCWAGEKRTHDDILEKIDGRRSISYSLFQPFMDTQDISFVSLQMGKPLAQAKGDDRLHVFEIGNWSDTAAIIHHLDLVISVDTAVLHLAAAMGKPTWLLNRYDTCWRWMLDREDSPWYKSLRIFRQSTVGDWQPVIDQVRAELVKDIKIAA